MGSAQKKNGDQNMPKRESSSVTLRVPDSRRKVSAAAFALLRRHAFLDLNLEGGGSHKSIAVRCHVCGDYSVVSTRTSERIM